MPIQVAQALIPSTVNTPIDARTVVNGTADIADIELPYIGMRVYCSGNGKEYRITSLKAKTIGALTVENAAVDEYEEIAEGGASTAPKYDGATITEVQAGANVTLSMDQNGTLTIAAQGGSSSGGLTAAQARRLALIFG